MPRRSFGVGKTNVLLRATIFGGDNLISIVDIRVSSLQYFTFILILKVILSVQKSFYWHSKGISADMYVHICMYVTAWKFKQTTDIPFR